MSLLAQNPLIVSHITCNRSHRLYNGLQGPARSRPLLLSLTSSVLSSILTLLYLEYVGHASTLGSFQWLLPLPAVPLPHISLMTSSPLASPEPVCLRRRKPVRALVGLKGVKDRGAGVRQMLKSWWERASGRDNPRYTSSWWVQPTLTMSNNERKQKRLCSKLTEMRESLVSQWKCP